MTPFRFLVLMMVCLAWGLHFVVVTSTVDDMPPIAYAGFRMVLVALLLIPFLKWHPGQMVRIAIAGVCFGGLNYALTFTGLTLLPASLAAILIEMYVPIAMLLSVLVLGEKVGWRRIGGMLLALFGVVIMLAGEPPEDLGPALYLGAALIVGAATAEAVGAVQVKRIERVSPLQMLAWFAIFGSSVTVTASLFAETDQFAFLATPARWEVLGALAYSVLAASLLGHASYYWLLQRADVSQVAPAGLMTTVIAVAAGVFFLGETFTLRIALGAIVAMIGVAIIVFRSAQRAAGDEALSLSGPVGARVQEPAMQGFVAAGTELSAPDDAPREPAEAEDVPHR